MATPNARNKNKNKGKKKQVAKEKDESEDASELPEAETKVAEPSGEYLLLSEHVERTFRQLTAVERSVTKNANTFIRTGKLNPQERTFLALLLTDYASTQEKLLERDEVKHAYCCAEFYCELLPTKLHRCMTATDLAERLTMAIRRSAMACRARENLRVASCRGKIPAEPFADNVSTDPLTMSEVFHVITITCEMELNKRELNKIRQRNLIIMTMSICKQGNLSSAAIVDKIKMIKAEMTLADLDVYPESMEKFWTHYGKFIVIPPDNVAMLDVENDEIERENVSESKKDETKGKKKEDTATASTSVDELTEKMSNVKIKSKNPWDSFFKRLLQRCEKSKLLQNFINNVQTSGTLTVISHFRMAYQNHPNFDWNLVLAEFRDEQKRLWSALEELHKDPYCFYRKPDIVHHSNFLHLGYLGVKLQEKAGGIVSLAGYKGFHRYHSRMPKRQQVDQWVSIYCAKWYEEPSKVDYRSKDPTLKYASFAIPDGKGTDDLIAMHGYIPSGKWTSGSAYAHPAATGYRGYNHHGNFDQDYFGGGQDLYGSQDYHGNDDYYYGNEDYYGKQDGYGYDDKDYSYGNQGYSDIQVHRRDKNSYVEQKNYSGYQRQQGNVGDASQYGGGRGGGRGGQRRRIQARQDDTYRGGYGGGPYGDAAVDATGDLGSNNVDYYRGLRDGYLLAGDQTKYTGRGRGGRPA